MTDARDATGGARPPMISDHGLALIVYLLYLAGFLTGVSAVVGLIIAMMQIERADPVSRSHFRFQIRTFWIGLAYIVAGVIAPAHRDRRADHAVVDRLDGDALCQGPAGPERRRADRRSGVLAVRLNGGFFA